MTKSVRIENADTSTYHKVVVITEDLVDDGGGRVWKETSRKELSYPTSLDTFGIHDSRRLRIEEAK